MLACVDRFEQFGARGGDVHAHHIEPRSHDLFHGGVRQREDAEQHLALSRAEGGLQGVRRRDEAVEAAVHPGEQQEQRAERGEGTPGEGQRVVGQLRSDARHAARQRVAENEQQHGRDPHQDERLEGRSQPPAERVPRRHGAEYQECEPRHVEGAVQRDPCMAGGGWSVPEGVERFSDGGLFAQREQPGPHHRDHGGDYAEPGQQGLPGHQRPLRSRRRT